MPPTLSRPPYRVVASVSILDGTCQTIATYADAFSGTGPVGFSPKEVVRIFPVIVTVHAIPESTPIWNRIHAMLAAQGLLVDPGVEPLQLIDIEEIEILEALLFRGVTLLEVLEARARDPERRNIGLKNFLIAKCSREGNDFLHKELDEIGAHAKRLFFGRK